MKVLEPFRRRRFRSWAVVATGVACLGVSQADGAGATLSGNADSHAARGHVLTGGRARRSTATLAVVSGTTSVQVSSGTRSGFLYRVSTPAGSGIRPLATLDNGTLR